MSGYSGTPLVKKLGIKPGSRLYACGAPDDYLQLIAPLPDGAGVATDLSAKTDFVHHFSTREAELAQALKTYRARLSPTATVWVSWPKKSSKLASDIVEGTIRELALPLGFVDIKVCAVSEVWSGLKLVVRKELR
jgi:hypothetical protein